MFSKIISFVCLFAILEIANALCPEDHLTQADSNCNSFVLCLQNERKVIACPTGF